MAIYYGMNVEGRLTCPVCGHQFVPPIPAKRYGSVRREDRTYFWRVVECPAHHQIVDIAQQDFQPVTDEAERQRVLEAVPFGKVYVPPRQKKRRPQKPMQESF